MYSYIPGKNAFKKYDDESRLEQYFIHYYGKDYKVVSMETNESGPSEILAIKYAGSYCSTRNFVLQHDMWVPKKY